MVMTYYVLANIRSAGTLSQNPQKAVTYICCLPNFTQLQLTNMQAKYWVVQMHCDPPNQNFGWWPTLQRPHDGQR